MKKRLIITNSILVFISLILTLTFSSGIIYKQNYDTYSKEVENYLSLTISIFDGTNFDDTKNSITSTDKNIRLTIIDTSGKVIVDTLNESIEENHLQRPELKNLREVYKRYSSTEHQTMMYIADLASSYYIRIAIPMGNIDSIMATYVSLSVLFLVIVETASVVLISFFIKKSLKPINLTVKELSSLAGKDYQNTDLEIDHLPNIMKDITEVLNQNINSIKQQQEEASSVMNLLNQGVVAINKDLEVVLLNKTAKKIFNEQDVLNRSYLFLIRDVPFQERIQQVIKNKINDNYILVLNKLTYECMINYVSNTWLSGGVVITLEDITQKEILEKTKKDFFQNASHELKSPLTSIIGYQQLITQGIVDDPEQINTYSLKTIKEANRMNDIIIDMLNLAELEQDYQTKKETFSLKKLILEIIDALDRRIKEKNIALELNLLDFDIKGDVKLLDELIRNLIDNAIKYNKEDGKISIILNKEKLIISDTGIGISKDNQKRVFERFYRVDKGRSKSVGGTGLGLAIVKHICEIYNYKIKMSSCLNEGTTIEIIF